MTDAPTDLRPLIIQGHAVEILQSLPDGCCRCAVTSPPYYGLRRYDVCSCSVEYVRQDVPHPHPQKKGTSVQRKDPDPNCAFCHGTGVLPDMDRVWGGDPECKHDWAEAKPRRTRKAADQGATSTMGTAIGANYDARSTKLCAKCGAWFGSLGLEPTPQLYVQHLTVDVIGEIQRVLAEDGSLWLNLGDSYSTHPAATAPAIAGAAPGAPGVTPVSSRRIPARTGSGRTGRAAVGSASLT